MEIVIPWLKKSGNFATEDLYEPCMTSLCIVEILFA